MEAIRHGVWDVRGTLLNRERRSGDDKVDEFLEVLKVIEGKLGIVEAELQVPGGILNGEIEKSINDGLSKLKSIFQGNESLKESDIKSVDDTLKELSPKVEKGPLIMPLEVVQVSGELNVEEFIEKVLREEPDQRVSAIPIVGTRTPTTLAQRVYHDTSVQSKFGKRHWVCMCELDHDHPSKLLDLVFQQNTCDEEILKEFHSIVKDQRYLLILDGTRQANLGELLSDLLSGVSYGSKVIVTGSDEATLGTLNPLFKPADAPMKLADVLRQDVWDSFEKVAFKDEKKEKDKLLDTGKKICFQYSTVPRLMKLIASFLSLKHTIDEWNNLHKDLKETLPVPAESYLSNFNLSSRDEELQSNIEQCESYCSLFPKDYEFTKTYLMHLWDSQEYLQTPTERPEELIGEELFEVLHDNRFFSKNTREDVDVVLGYRMHDKVNEFLKGMEKPEFHFVDDPSKEVANADKIRHLSIIVDSTSSKEPSLLLQHTDNKLESLLLFPRKLGDYADIPNLKHTLLRLTCLRALDLVAVNCVSIIFDLGNLKELRYLRLGVSPKRLPENITKLQKLKTLDLQHSGVTELPQGFNNLKNLRHLYTGRRLIEMPQNFGELESLQNLDVFIVGHKNGLQELAGLKELVGKITICYKNHVNIDKVNLNDMNLTELSMVWSSSYPVTEDIDREFGHLRPPHNLKSIAICRWKGTSFPLQLSVGDATFNSLTSVHIEDCAGCKVLPNLSTLPHLKFLKLWDLNVLEYIEDPRDGTASLSIINRHYFPSLEYVMLANLPELTAWSPKALQQHLIPSPRLSLCVSGCPKMFSMPLMRCLVSLKAHNIRGSLLKNLLSTNVGPSPRATLKKLEIVSITNLEDPTSIKNLTALESLAIRQCPQLKKLVIASLNSLQRLEIHDCEELEQITSVPERLSSLKSLEIKRCEKLELIKKPSHGKAWKCFDNLHSLKLMNIANLGSLESALGSLEKLEELTLCSIYELRTLPMWMENLKQLRRPLAIRNCPFLCEIPESLRSLVVPKCCPKLKYNPQQREI